MTHLQFETSVNELIRLDGPLNMGSGPGAAVPRWQRKAMESKEKGLCSSPSATKRTPTRFAKSTPSRCGREGTLSKSPNGDKNNKTPCRDVPKQPAGGDRFIPNRALMDMDLSHFKIMQDSTTGGGDDIENAANYDSAPIREKLGDHTDAKILTFKERAPKAQEGYSNNLKVLYSSSKSAGPKKGPSRYIPQSAERILDAPMLRDDFYLNLMDWSSKNIVAIALDTAVYLWNANSGEIDHLFQIEGESDYITAVAWLKDSDVLAVGNSLGQVLLWDVVKHKCLRCMEGHPSRVGTLSWNSYILSSGARSGSIHHHDVRVADHLLATADGHTQEVCGMAWSPDGKYIASGGNDNLLNVWDSSRAMGGSEPLYSINQHQAAVKAISWCPWQPDLLASGGGTADRTIRFWNAQTGLGLKTTDAKSQVSSIVWSREHKELVTGHGYSQNQLTVWKYSTMERLADLKGHTNRVLTMCLSPDEATVVSAAADETLRFWNCFAPEKKHKKSTSGAPNKKSAKSFIGQTIR